MRNSINSVSRIANSDLDSNSTSDSDSDYDFMSYSPDMKLMYVAESGDIDTVQRLINNGIDVNDEDVHGQTALIYAAGEGHVEIVKCLINVEDIRVDTRNRRGKTALMYAAEQGHVEIVDCLINAVGIDVNTKDHNGKTALMYAAEQGHVTIIQCLMDVENIDIHARDENGRIALIYAARCCHTDAFKLLMNAKNIPHKYIVASLMKAAKNGGIDIVEYILGIESIGVDAKDENDCTALMHAASNGKYKVVELLLAKGAAVNAVDREGRTALIYASSCGHVNVVRSLMDAKGIDLGIKDQRRNIALDYAIEIDKVEIVVLLSSDFKKLELFNSAIRKMSFNTGKYLLCSGEVLCDMSFDVAMSNIYDALRGVRPYPKFLIKAKETLRLLKARKLSGMGGRTNLLAARAFGVRLESGWLDVYLSLEKFDQVSSVLRAAKLRSITYDVSEYLLLRTLLMQGAVSGMLSKLCSGLKANVLDFLLVGGANLVMPALQVIEDPSQIALQRYRLEEASSMRSPSKEQSLMQQESTKRPRID